MLVETNCRLWWSKAYWKGTNYCQLQFCKHYVLGKQTRVKIDLVIHDTKMDSKLCSQWCVGTYQNNFFGRYALFCFFCWWLFKKKRGRIWWITKMKYWAYFWNRRKLSRLRLVERSKDFTKIMVVNKRMINFYKYVKMRLLCDISLFKIHHNRTGWQNAWTRLY